MSTSVVTVPQLIDCIDAFYYWVRGRVTAANPSRVFGGIVQARDWPMKEAVLEAPYLLLSSDTPVPFIKSVSQTQPSMLFRVQWAWMVQGDNIPANAQATNRGNKYRLNMQIVQEMLAGHFPGFCEKLQYYPQDNGHGVAQLVSISYSPAEQIRWTQPRFVDKIDRSTGILFCSGMVSISGFAPAILQ